MGAVIGFVVEYFTVWPGLHATAVSHAIGEFSFILDSSPPGHHSESVGLIIREISDHLFPTALPDESPLPVHLIIFPVSEVLFPVAPRKLAFAVSLVTLVASCIFGSVVGFERTLPLSEVLKELAIVTVTVLPRFDTLSVLLVVYIGA